jgi:hypothetical protein
MRQVTKRHVAPITPVHALFITALLAITGASDRTRRGATKLFERSATSVVWVILSRQSDIGFTWLRLVSITFEVTSSFLQTWPTSGTMTISSMMTTLETCTHAVVNRVADMAPLILAHSPLGVLTLLTYDERLQLLQCVHDVLAPEHECTLLAAMENDLAGPLGRHVPSDRVFTAVEQLEDLLLQSCAYTLGAPETICGPIAA